LAKRLHLYFNFVSSFCMALKALSLNHMSVSRQCGNLNFLCSTCDVFRGKLNCRRQICSRTTLSPFVVLNNPGLLSSALFVIRPPGIESFAPTGSFDDPFEKAATLCLIHHLNIIISNCNGHIGPVHSGAIVITRQVDVGGASNDLD